MLLLFLAVPLQENKTPYDLALEKDYNSVAAMVADYRDNGPSALQLYEKRRAHPPNDGKVSLLYEKHIP